MVISVCLSIINEIPPYFTSIVFFGVIYHFDVTTSSKEVMFSPEFVCLSLHKINQKVRTDLKEIFRQINVVNLLDLIISKVACNLKKVGHPCCRK